MSAVMVEAVFARSRAAGVARLVLLSLARYASAEGTAWRPLAAMMQDANTTRQSVYRVLHELEAMGEIVAVTDQSGRPMQGDLAGRCQLWVLLPGGEAVPTEAGNPIAGEPEPTLPAAPVASCDNGVAKCDSGVAKCDTGSIEIDRDITPPVRAMADKANPMPAAFMDWPEAAQAVREGLLMAGWEDPPGQLVADVLRRFCEHHAIKRGWGELSTDWPMLARTWARKEHPPRRSGGGGGRDRAASTDFAGLVDDWEARQAMLARVRGAGEGAA